MSHVRSLLRGRLVQYLPMALESPGVARQQLVIDLRDAGVVGELGDDALVVLSELVSNAVRHGAAIRSPLGSGLGVAWDISASDVTITVLDAGCGPAAAVPDSTWGFDESGRGLGIVAGLSSEWGVDPLDDHGVAVWARLRR